MFIKKRDLKGVIKRPCNPYISFFKQEFPELKKQNPSKSTRELNKMVSEQWASLEKEDKALYIKEYQDSLVEYKSRYESHVGLELERNKMKKQHH